MERRVDRTLSLIAPTVGALVLSGAAAAQEGTPLDAGYSDLNSLQTSLRALPPVMRHDSAFEHVYQSPLDPNDRYRVAGGLYAVFNASEYDAGPGGNVPTYPAGVQFHIGPPIGFGSGPLDPATAALLRETDPRFDLRSVDRDRTDAVTDRSVTVVRMPAPVPTISSESVRQQRLREITARALRETGSGG